MPDILHINSQTERMCPFAGMTIDESNNVTGVKCIKSDCQLWIQNNTSSSDPFLNTVSQNTSRATLDDDENGTIDGGRCGAQVSDFNESIFRLLHHYHRHHSHPLSHYTSTYIPTSGGNPFYNTTVPRSLHLSLEADTLEDQDGNGKIIGRDFGIIIDQNTPNSIRNIYYANGIAPSVYVTWDDYLNNIYRPYFKSCYPNRLNYITGGLIKITGGFFHAEDPDFTITFQMGNPSKSIPYVTVSGINNIRIASSTLMYVKVPTFEDYKAFTENDEIYMNFKITNSGNTFDLEGFENLYTNTGGEKLVSNAMRLNNEPNTESTQEKLQEEWDELA